MQSRFIGPTLLLTMLFPTGSIPAEAAPAAELHAALQSLAAHSGVLKYLLM